MQEIDALYTTILENDITLYIIKIYRRLGGNRQICLVWLDSLLNVYIF